ncbi:MAG: lysine N(6)-hydroxylase/L-ornithine N(5)-oxygenase family protein [Synechococcaceae cyanobacterium SM2_3_2]|nr:lysine N(6)-hydroxylase/L-ornithine N(5)-oxygenase family protein [Synechococcaceae cyanobacterium SM2_3_2]
MVFSSDSVDIAVIGAGPQALTLVTHLLQKRKDWHTRIRVLDPSGGWLNQWQRQFRAQEIPHLRSPAVHHPDPNPYELRRFAERDPQGLIPPYDRPTSAVFEGFCQDVVLRWKVGSLVMPAQVSRIRSLCPGFELFLSDGHILKARRVVLARGAGIPALPSWSLGLEHPPGRLCHSSLVNLPSLSLEGETLVIVGGGLTSGHLALGAVKRGAQVILMTRRTARERLFDTDPGWLGPKYLKGFEEEECWQARWQQIQSARDGGSLTPEVLTQIRSLAHQGSLVLQESCQIVGAVWQMNRWQIRCLDGGSLRADRIWLATGSRVDLADERILDPVLKAHPIDTVQGLPILDQHLRWQGCELFVMGGLAGLQVGPVARNLSGARMAAQKIVPALAKSSLIKWG